MAHQLSTAGTGFIKSFEGLRLTAYNDGFGIMTIGYGHTADVKAGQVITQAQADAYFTGDVAWAVADVNRGVTEPLSQSQFDALVSFTFNVGGGAFKSSTLLKKLNAGGYTAVPSELNKWVHSGRKKKGFLNAFIRWAHLGSGEEVVPGLQKRRAEEGKIWSTGQYSRTL